MYDNQYNTEIIQKIKKNTRKYIKREEINNNLLQDTPVTTQLEIQTEKDHKIIGGSAFEATTLHDRGFEETIGAVGGSKPKPKTKKIKQGGNIVGLIDLDVVKGNPPIEGEAPIVRAAPASNKTKTPKKMTPIADMNAIVGSAKPKRVNKYAILVKEIMAKHNLKMIEASKYIKENNLYKKD